jgi:hypothetical protein
MQNRISLRKSLPLLAGASLILLGSAVWAQGTAGSDFKRKPGSWMMKMTVEKLEGGGMTEAIRAQMQNTLNESSKTPLCLTDAAAAQENFVANMQIRPNPMAVKPLPKI